MLLCVYLYGVELEALYSYQLEIKGRAKRQTSTLT